MFEMNKIIAMFAAVFSVAAILHGAAAAISGGGGTNFCESGDEGKPWCQSAVMDDVNYGVQPYLTELLKTPLFRYFKANLNRPCPFWKEDLVCSSQGCAIATVPNDPNGWEAKLNDVQFPNFQLAGNIFKSWDFENDEFCSLDKDGETGVYVDLVENPERFTSYSGPSANRVWRSIYEENCFSQEDTTKQQQLTSSTGSAGKWKQCLERHLFYRVVSGLHASISVHLADEYWNRETRQWESNRALYEERVGKFPERIDNIYLVYSVLYRAICRLLLHKRGNIFSVASLDESETQHLKELIKGITSKLGSCPTNQDLTIFASSRQDIIDEFKDHFRNVTKIMDCVSCERCRLWGKIQTTGIGTALKILSVSDAHFRDDNTFKLRRAEIVALLNTYGRFSESVAAIRKFRRMAAEEMRANGGAAGILRDLGGLGGAAAGIGSSAMVRGRLSALVKVVSSPMVVLLILSGLICAAMVSRMFGGKKSKVSKEKTK